MSTYKIHVSKDYLMFCAAHFITHDGVCEPLHGHNYRVSVTLEGDTQADHLVFNFVTLKRTLRQLVDQLDHRTLLPATNPHFKLSHTNHEITIDVGDRRYMLPEADVLVLPIPNTTAELLAKYLADQLRAVLGEVANLTVCEMTVDEVEGQSATYREAWR